MNNKSFNIFYIIFFLVLVSLSVYRQLTYHIQSQQNQPEENILMKANNSSSVQIHGANRATGESSYSTDANFKLPGFLNAKPFPVVEMQGSVEKNITAAVEIHKYREKKDRSNTVKIVFAGKTGWNGVALLDADGMTLTSVSKGLLSESWPVGPTIFITDVISADFNRDGKTDYFLVLNGSGCGLMWTAQPVFILSGPDGYKTVWFETYMSGAHHIVEINNDGRCFLIAEEMIWTDMHLPVPDETEIPGDFAAGLPEKKRKEMALNEIWMTVYYPLEITGQKLLEANEVDNKLPCFISYFRGGAKGKTETKLLSQKQKQVLWDSNFMDCEIMGSEHTVRHKEFMKKQGL